MDSSFQLYRDREKRREGHISLHIVFEKYRRSYSRGTFKKHTRAQKIFQKDIHVTPEEGVQNNLHQKIAASAKV